MAGSRPARAGVPISVKLIVTTSVLVAAAVGTATYVGQRAIADLSDSQNASQRSFGERAIHREAELLMQAGGIQVAAKLAHHADVGAVLAALVADDRQHGDSRLQWLVVEDLDPKMPLLARTEGAPSPDALAEYEYKLRDRLPNNGVVHAQTSDSLWVYGADITVAGKVAARFRIGVSVDGFEHELKAAIASSDEVVRNARIRALLVALVVLALGIALAAFHGIQLARPIQELTARAERMAAGDLDSRVEDRRRDELGVLAHTFNVMSAEIRRLLADRSRKASLEQEMSLARQVQQAMLPPDRLDQHGAIKVVGYCMPASTCGGDWWTYRKLSGSRLLMVVGDATGHGIHSAMIAATARGAVEALKVVEDSKLTPDKVLLAIDLAIRQLGDPSVLMTAFAAIFDSSNNDLHYANAGQNFPYVWKLGASRVLEEPRILSASGNPLGDHKIPVDIRVGKLMLRPGDLFVCFTDGLVERANADGQAFGDRRLRGAMNGEQLFDSADLISLRDRIVGKLETYAQGTVAEDDVTLVMIQFDPAQARSPTQQASGRGAA